MLATKKLVRLNRFFDLNQGCRKIIINNNNKET